MNEIGSISCSSYPGTAGKQDAPPHIAFVGLDDEDVKVSRLLRKRVQMVFRAQILFYPTRNRHQALTDWLMALADKYATATGSQTAEEIQPLAVPPQLKTALPDQYVHQPTDDDNYQGRTQDFATLNRWANDPATRTIAVTGIGGQGKTALTGRWLKQERSPELAEVPVFYWSFYEDLDIGKFLKQVLEFCLPVVRVVGRGEEQRAAESPRRSGCRRRCGICPPASRTPLPAPKNVRQPGLH